MTQYKCIEVCEEGSGLFTVGETYTFTKVECLYPSEHRGTMSNNVAATHGQLNNYVAGRYCLISKYSTNLLAYFVRAN